MMEPREQWEYCCIMVRGNLDELNALGLSGWEAYAVESRASLGYKMVYLKRRISQKGGAL